MSLIQITKHLIRLKNFEEKYDDITELSSNFDCIKNFHDFDINNLKSENDKIMLLLEKINQEYSDTFNFFDILNSSKKDHVLHKLERDGELILGHNGQFNRFLEASKMLKEAIIPVLEKIENEEFQTSWNLMKSYADKEFYNKKDKNIELFMPILHSIYLKMLIEGLNTNDDDLFMKQQKVLVNQRHIDNRDIDMLNLCILYTQNNSNSLDKEYQLELNTLIPKLIKNNDCHDTLTKLASEITEDIKGIEDIVDQNNLVIAQAINQKDSTYLAKYLTELEFRNLIYQVNELNDMLTTSSLNTFIKENNLQNNQDSHTQYINKYIAATEQQLLKIEKNFVNTSKMNKDSDFFKKEEKFSFINAYKEFLFPVIVALNENNLLKAYDITTEYFNKENSFLDNNDSFYISTILTELALNVFLLNAQHIKVNDKEIISKLLDCSSENESNEILQDLVNAVFNGKSLKNELKNLENNDINEIDNFIIAKNITELSNKNLNSKIKIRI